MKLYERRKLDYSVAGLLGVAVRSLARGGVVEECGGEMLWSAAGCLGSCS